MLSCQKIKNHLPRMSRVLSWPAQEYKSILDEEYRKDFSCYHEKSYIMNQCTPVHILPPTQPACLSTQAQAQCSNSLVQILLQSLKWIELTIPHWKLLSSLCLADLFTISISLYQSHILWRKQRVLDLLRKSLQPLAIRHRDHMYFSSCSDMVIKDPEVFLAVTS